jgi:hypothetical protein
MCVNPLSRCHNVAPGLRTRTQKRLIIVDKCEIMTIASAEEVRIS